MILDILFPKYCYICNRKGNYICDVCKKSLKTNLPECYICRRISPLYQTHKNCIKSNVLDRVFIGWEYNDISSIILRKYKYKGVYDISPILSQMLTDILIRTNFIKFLQNSLIIPVPTSLQRLNDRGFNQTELIAKEISTNLNINYSSNILGKHYDSGHQALRDRSERLEYSKNSFYIRENIDLLTFKSITLFDDVITTGKTLENIKSLFPKETTIQAICLFRGKPYYKLSTF